MKGDNSVLTFINQALATNNSTGLEMPISTVKVVIKMFKTTAFVMNLSRGE